MSLIILSNLQALNLTHNVSHALKRRYQIHRAAKNHLQRLSQIKAVSNCQGTCQLDDEHGRWTYRYQSMGAIACGGKQQDVMRFFQLTLRHQHTFWQQSFSDKSAKGAHCQLADKSVITSGLHTLRRQAIGYSNP